MKKWISICLALVMCFALAACTKQPAPTTNDTPSAPDVSAPEPVAPAPEPEPEPVKHEGEVSVYVAHNAEQYNAVIEMFNAVYPDVEVLVVSAGTGDCLQRIAAESNNPQCDVMWGGTTESLEAYKQYFQPFTSEYDAFIDEMFKDPDRLWTGESQQPAVIMYNKNLVSEDEAPKLWTDLLDAKWEGKIASANPGSSGSAYTLMCNIVQATSTAADYADGWENFQNIAKNIILSGGSSSVYKGVANGEYSLGLTLEQLAWVYVKDNADLGMIYPEDGSTNVPDGFAMIKDCKNPENAELFMNFLLTTEVQQLMSDDHGRRTVRNDMAQPDALPKLDDIYFINYDFACWGAGKEAAVAKWEGIEVNVVAVQ
ncbi:extracellular solute-binding protein [Eubacteriales bacterium OttesenSCG-928-K08]|nr:extracellular solute-binding protein [Eubacteriales bacterium OttesenSCG-928-K08]